MKICCNFRHGVKQPRNPWSDGPEYITQCPIKPGSSFNYNIILSSEEGTLWWHAHSDWTRATVHGVIVIYPANGTRYPFPNPYKEVPIVIGLSAFIVFIHLLIFSCLYWVNSVIGISLST